MIAQPHAKPPKHGSARRADALAGKYSDDSETRTATPSVKTSKAFIDTALVPGSGEEAPPSRDANDARASNVTQRPSNRSGLMELSNKNLFLRK